MNGFRLLAATALLAAVAGVAPAHALTPSERADRALDRGLNGLVAMRAGPPGAWAMVQRGRSARLHTAGVADLRTRRPIRARDGMRVASVAKAFSGATALALVARGTLSLDDTIASRLPSLPAAWGAVTLRQALHHTSGLPDFSASKAFRDAFQANPRAVIPPERLLEFIAGEPLQFAPGSRYRYSNADNIVVGLMVAAATGRSYEAALRSRVLRPLGLSRTSLPRGISMPSPAIRGYGIDPPDAPEDLTFISSASWSWASGGVVSTPADLNRFIRGYVGGRLFGGATRAAQRRWVTGTSEPPGPGRNSPGLALFRYRTRCGTLYGHTGNIFGYTQFAAASADGSRSATVGISRQLTLNNDPRRFPALRRVFELAACAALAR